MKTLQLAKDMRSKTDNIGANNLGFKNISSKKYLSVSDTLYRSI